MMPFIGRSISFRRKPLLANLYYYMERYFERRSQHAQSLNHHPLL
jgi:hypothetical protein